jgi:hypothetical protein
VAVVTVAAVAAAIASANHAGKSQVTVQKGRSFSERPFSLYATASSYHYQPSAGPVSPFFRPVALISPAELVRDVPEDRIAES